MFKKFIEYIVKQFKKLFFNKPTSPRTKLDMAMDKLNAITDYIKHAKFPDSDTVLSGIASLEYVRFLKGNISRMRKCTDGKMFSLLHDDTLHILDIAICPDAEVQRHIDEIKKILSKPENINRDTSTTVCCSVVFAGSTKEYHYLVHDKHVSVGQYVYVPTGWEMELKVARVIKIQTIEEAKSPIPTPELKWVIGPAF